jgi:hypothetical protein
MAAKKVINRSSVTGRIVTAKYAHAHPATTERQHVNVPKPGRSGGKKGR